LFCHQQLVDHLTSNVLGFLWRVNNANSPLESVLEGTASTSTGENLRFQHKILGVQILGDLLGLGCGTCNAKPVNEREKFVYILIFRYQ
jgi:hypothetical protein